MSVIAEARPADRVVAPGPRVRERLSDAECALFAIITDESGLDQAEFCWHDPKTEDGCFRAWPFQWAWWRCDDQLQADQCGRSIGKALDVDTPVPTPDGWTTMGALCVGDMVYDDAGQPTTVLEAFDVQVDRPCAEVRFDDGNAIVADLDHLWGTWTGTPSDRQFRVRTTAEIGRTLRRKGQNDHRVDVAGPIAGTRAGLPFSPYALGYWLGDGASGHSGLTIGDQDIDDARAIIESEGFVLRKRRDLYGYGVHFPSQWIDLPTGPAPPTTTQRVSDEQVREIRERARLGEPLLELAAAFDTSAASITQWVVGQYRRSAGGPVREPEIPVGRVLVALGLIGNKHIPRNYLRASVANRLALLQGLMDSDGHCRGDGRCEITLTNERLIQDVYELLVSLGQKPFFERKRATLRGVDVGPAYRIGFHPIDITPFRFKRKASRVRPPRRQERVRQRRVVAVRAVATRPVRCIRVAAKSHMFLVGRGFIPTHNSESIKARVCAFPLCFPGEEMVITAPELIHLEPIISKVEDQIFRTRLLSELVAKGRRSVTHRPFEMVFANGARLVGRIPQRDGRGMKGLHPLRLELDEGQDFPRAGYSEIFETLKMGEPKSQWRIHGVPRGTRDAFHKITTSNKDFTVHRITAMSRPTWTKQERAKKIRQYGSSDDPDYRRNIKGEHGDVTNALFVLSKLYACVDLDPVSEYNLIEFHKVLIRDSDLSFRARQENREEADILIDLLDLPQRHLDRYSRFWIGMDVGFTSDPSEILIFAEYHPDDEERKIDKTMERAVPAKGHTRVRCIGRITLRRVSAPLQEIAIAHLFDFYQPQAFAMDKTGNGLPLYQAVLDRLRQSAGDDRDKQRRYAASFRGYNFSSKVIVDVDETVTVEDKPGQLPSKAETLMERDDVEEVVEKAAIKQTVLEYSTDALRKLVDNGRLMLPFEDDEDDEDGPGGGGTIVEEFQGMTFSYSKSPIDAYGKRRRVFQEGRFHAFDGARMAAMALFQTPIETFLAQKKAQAPVFDYFVSV